MVNLSRGIVTRSRGVSGTEARNKGIPLAPGSEMFQMIRPEEPSQSLRALVYYSVAADAYRLILNSRGKLRLDGCMMIPSLR